MNENGRVEAVDRALLILQALAEAGPDGVSLAQLAERTGVNKSTVHRSLATMRQRDFAHQQPDGSYQLGAAALALASPFGDDAALASSLHPALAALSQTANELAHLGVLRGGAIVYLDKVEPERAIRVWSRVGQRVSVATSALGRAILAADGATHNQLRFYSECTEGSPSLTLERLTEAVEQARTRGFSTEIEENEPGVACLGVALQRDGRAIAALSLTCLAERLSEDRRAELGRMVHEVVPRLLPDGVTLFTPAH